MSYTIKKSDGSTLATVPENDIVLDKASVALIGRGSTNYGIKHSEAFVHLLENFAHTTPPAYPLEGQLWFDKTVSALKLYVGGAWKLVGSGGGSGDGSGAGSGAISVAVGSSSVLVFLANGKVVAVLTSVAVANGDLPVSITVLSTDVAFRSRFPSGLKAGYNLASDPSDYVINGHVPAADAALWTGGGNPFTATTYLEISPSASVALTISNGSLIAAYSKIVVAQASLPVNFVVNGVTVPFRSVFGNGLRAGLTLADSFGIGVGAVTITSSGTGGGGGGGGGVTTEIVAQMIGEETTARSTAISQVYSYANTTFATAGVVNTLESTFKSGTGQTTLAGAIEYLITTAGSGTANADYAIQLRSEIKNAVSGATSFADALQKMATAANGDYVTSSQLTSLQSTLNGNISTATQNMVTTSSLSGALATFKTSLESTYGLNGLSASVSTLAGTVAGIGGRTAAFWQVESVAGNNRARLSVRADANSGAGVDIVGDVNFSGNLNVGADTGGNRMKITNNNLSVYDANGTLRVRLGQW